MSDMLQIRAVVTGNRELAALFPALTERILDRLREALIEAGVELREAAAALAPRRTGTLAGKIRAKLNERPGMLIESVRPIGREGFIGRLMEFGVVNHGTIRNRSGRFGRLMRVREVRELRAHGQYRIRPRPFMQPAFEGLRDQIEARLAGAVAEALAERD